MLTRAQLLAIYPNAPAADLDQFVAQAPTVLKAAGILDGRNRLQFFLAQIGHESAGLSLHEEGLSYSKPERLMAVWPSRFPTLASAQPYANNPQGLAEKIYGGRMGNLNPGDGYRFHGRGYIQITGRDTYAAVGAAAGLPLLDQPGLAADPQHALAVACGYWTWAKLNGPCDSGDFITATKRINGGTVGLDDRKAWLAKVQASINWPLDDDAASDDATVRAMQTRLKELGLYVGSIDGVIGNYSRGGLRAFQASKSLPVTGELDPATRAALGI